MRLSTKISGIVAIGGVAALGSGLISSGGIGAAFTDSATATANIDVGTFGCTFSGADWSINNTGATSTASIDLGELKSSAAGSKTAPLTLTNTGDINAFASWSVSAITGSPVLPSEFSAAPAPAAAVLAPGNTEAPDLGFTWTELDNHALGTNGSVTYTVTCTEAPDFLVNHWLFADGAAGESSATWTGSSVALAVTGTTTDSTSYPWGPSAGISLLDIHAGSTLPSSPPNYTRQEVPWNSGGPRLDIELSNGVYVRGYSWNAGSPLGWEYPGNTTGHGTWAQVQDYVSANSNPTVTSVNITLDTSGAVPYTAHVTCVNYSGTPLFGTC